MQSKPAFEGGLCGAMRYRLTEAPRRRVICHCTMGRRHSGAPTPSFVHFPKAAFSWLGVEPTHYRSSDSAERSFCPQCGSTMSMHEEVLSYRMLISVGTLDDPNRVCIDHHAWTQDRIACSTFATICRDSRAATPRWRPGPYNSSRSDG